MNKLFILPAVLFSLWLHAFAAVPNWFVAPSGFEHNMTISGVIFFNNVESTDENDIVAAFVGNDCRGIARLKRFPVTGHYTYGLIIYSNQPSGETVTFKAYDASSDKIMDISITRPFEANENVGSDLDPLQLYANATAGISVIPTTGLTTSETSGTATFNVIPTSPPTAPVVIPLSSSDITEGTVPASVTLPAGSTAPVSVIVTGVNDNIVDGSVSYTITTGDPSSSDLDFDILTAADVADVSVTNIDDDIAAIIVTPTSGLITTEDGGTATFRIYSNTEPLADVTIPLSSSDESEGTVPSSATLPAGSMTPFFVTITGVSDNNIDGDIAYTIITGDPTSMDPAYNLLTADDIADVTAVNEDATVNHPPQVNSTSPSSGQFKDPIQLSSQYSDPDDDPITQIEYQYSLNGLTNWISIIVDNSPADGYLWNTDPDINEAIVWLRARAYDGAQWSEWKIADGSFMVDNTSPAFSNWQLQPSAITTRTTGAATVSVDIVDLLSGLSESSVMLKYKIGDSVYGGYQTMNYVNGNNYYFQIPAPTDGWNNHANESLFYTVKASDIMGNIKEEEKSTTIQADDTISDMMAYYPFNGNAYDMSGNNYHGNPSGVTSTSDKAGESNQAYYFDGSNDYISLPFQSDDFGTNITMTAWVYRSKNTPYPYIQGVLSNDISTNRGISIGALPTSNKLQACVYNMDGASTYLEGEIIPLNQWQFVAMVYDGANVKIYQNNLLKGTQTFSGNLRGSADFRIGCDQYDVNAGRFWQGTIDNVRFYDRALSAAEIAEIYALEGGTVVNHPPAVTALLPNSGSFKDPVYISATASDPDAGDQVVAIKYEYNLGGTDWVAVGEDATPGDPLAWTSGLNWNNVNLRAKAFDGVLWSTDWFVTMGSFTVDNTPPQFSGWMTAPADLSTSATGPLHVSVKVGDDFSGFGSNVPQLDYYLTGASYDGYEAMTQLDAVTWIFDIPEPAGGWSAQGGKSLYFKAQAADELGNSAESTEQTRPVYSGPVPPLVHYDFDQNCLNKGTGGSGWNLVSNGAAYDGSELRLGTAAARLTQSAAIQQNFESGNVTTELGEPFTISGWFKWDGSPFLKTSGLQVQASQQSVGAIMGQGDYPGDIPCEGSGSRHWALSLDTQNGKLGFVINSAGCGGEWQQNWSESQAVNANQWNWFCLSHDGSGVLSLYVNDVLAASRTDHVTGGGGEFNTGLYVGSGYYYYYSPIYPDYEVTTYFPGYLDDIRIYRRELTSAERSSLYHEGGWPLNTPPVVTALTPASGNHPDPVQLSALYADADAGDIISALQYQYSLDGSSGWTEIVEDATPADGFAWNSGMAGTALYLRARAFDGKEWGDWYTNSSPISIVEATTTHTLNLSAGWSMISSYVIPEDNALPVLCSDIAANMTILKNGAGNVYWPQFTINTIGAWNHLAGYQIHMKNPATLEVTGQAILPESTPISLIQGWNLIGYMRNTSQNVTTALSNVVSSMVIAKNGAGRVYWPAFSINTIGNMMPGEGYQLYTNQAATLTYAANSLAKDEGGSKSLSFASRHYQPCLVNSGRYWIIGIDGGALEEGDEVSAWTRSDRLLAAGAIAQGKTVLVIPGDDPMTEDAVEGCAEDERVVLRIWRRSDGMERPMDGWSAEDALTGVPLGDQLTYRTDAVTIVRTSASTLSTISGYRLEQNFPNPFNPETSIRFALPQAEDVRIVVMNLQGQQMRVLVDEQCAPGSHTIIWDGRDDYGQSVASGLYIVRMISGGFTVNLKISFVK